VFSQKIFSYLQDSGDHERIWHVPVFLRAGSKSGIVQKTVLLTERELRIELPDADWVAVNAAVHGVYRARYSGDLLDALQQRAQSDLTPVERFGLINDS
jgi:aminopeptidase N